MSALADQLPVVIIAEMLGVPTELHEREAVEKIIAGMPNPPEIVRTGWKAFYSPSRDRVTLPLRELFVSAEEFYATALHETVHSTGSQARLARESILEAAPFGSATYSREEMVAELGAAYLCAEAGISNAVLENQAAYVAAG